VSPGRHRPDDRAVYAEVGARIRAERTRRGLSGRGLARRAGVSHAHLNHIERGIHGLTVAVFLSICDALGADPAVLLGPTPGDGP